jgi:hypothetical protein
VMQAEGDDTRTDTSTDLCRFINEDTIVTIIETPLILKTTTIFHCRTNLKAFTKR